MPIYEVLKLVAGGLLIYAAVTTVMSARKDGWRVGIRVMLFIVALVAYALVLFLQGVIFPS